MAKQTFKLEQLFGSKTRARLIGLFLANPDTFFFVRELTRKIDAQLNSVRRELKNLIQLGLIVELAPKKNLKKKVALSEKKKFYGVNQDFILYADLRSLFKKVQILLKKNLVQEIEKQGRIDYFAFTGHFVDDSEVPTDIIIIGDIKQKILEKMISEFEAEVTHEINYTLMNKEEFIYRQQVTDRFLASILNGKKVIMVDKLHK